jgi:hypothetical protein
MLSRIARKAMNVILACHNAIVDGDDQVAR